MGENSLGFVVTAMIFIGFVSYVTALASTSIWSVSTTLPECELSGDWTDYITAIGCSFNYMIYLVAVTAGLVTEYPALNLIVTVPLAIGLLYLIARLIRGGG